ncbi:MAG: hypothetical protein LBG11_09075, partial [Bifidobacteriaceae bacterium]|nr:hypothetical protein [Bifidobacteriaceae bacterium]
MTFQPGGFQPLPPQQPGFTPPQQLGPGNQPQATTFLEVAGESYYRDEIRAVFTACGERIPREGEEPGRRRGKEIRAAALLIPEPTNPYDSNAVAVYIAGNKVGHLEAVIAPSVQPALLARGPAPLEVPARVWALDDDGLIRARITVEVPTVLIGPRQPALPPPAAPAPRQAWYKRWWVWVIIVLVLAGIGQAMNGATDDAKTGGAPSPSASEATIGPCEPASAEVIGAIDFSLDVNDGISE